jgi:predicted PurR-regulated permease PerM
MSRREPKGTAFDYVFMALAVLLGAAFLYSVRSVWHPLVLLGAAALLMWPYRESPAISRVLLAMATVGFVWAFNAVSSLLTPLFVALALAYVFAPLARWLSAATRNWGFLRLRSSAVALILCLLILALIGFIGAETGGLLIRQSDELADLVEEAEVYISEDLPGLSQDSGVTGALVQGAVDALEEITQRIPEISRSILTSLGGVVTGALGVLITLLFFYYLVKDYNNLRHGFRQRYIPDSVNHFLETRLSRINSILRSFLHGYMITSTIVFFLTLGLLLAFGIEIAFLLALLAGILNVVPVVGFWITAVLILLVALATGNDWMTLFFLWAGLAGINVLEGNFLSPRIVGRKVGLHPVAVILSIGIFGRLLGVAGVLLGIPLAAILSREWEDFLRRRKERSVPDVN